MKITAREYEIKIGKNGFRRGKIEIEGSPDETLELLTMYPNLLPGAGSPLRISSPLKVNHIVL